MNTLLQQLASIGKNLEMATAKKDCKAFLLSADLETLKALKNTSTLIAWLDRDCYTKQGSLTGSGLPCLIEIEEQSAVLCEVVKADNDLPQAAKDKLCSAYKQKAMDIVLKKRYGDNFEQGKKVLLGNE